MNKGAETEHVVDHARTLRGLCIETRKKSVEIRESSRLTRAHALRLIYSRKHGRSASRSGSGNMNSITPVKAPNTACQPKKLFVDGSPEAKS